MNWIDILLILFYLVGVFVVIWLAQRFDWLDAGKSDFYSADINAGIMGLLWPLTLSIGLILGFPGWLSVAVRSLTKNRRNNDSTSTSTSN